MTLRELLAAAVEENEEAQAELHAWLACPECRFHFERLNKRTGLRWQSELNDWEDHRAAVHRRDAAEGASCRTKT